MAAPRPAGRDASAGQCSFQPLAWGAEATGGGCTSQLISDVTVTDSGAFAPQRGPGGPLGGSGPSPAVPQGCLLGPRRFSPEAPRTLSSGSRPRAGTLGSQTLLSADFTVGWSPEDSDSPGCVAQAHYWTVAAADPPGPGKSKTFLRGPPQTGSQGLNPSPPLVPGPAPGPPTGHHVTSQSPMALS